MEEVDKIIIHSLRDIGCDIGDDTDSLDGFTTELVVDAAARCLEIISPGLEIPRLLPVNMAARFRVGASIAGAAKELGYNGEVGYQTFLYSNVTDLRKVFIFLIEKLPRESDKSVAPEPNGPLSRLKIEISRTVRSSLNSRLTLADIESFPFISQPLVTGIAVPREKLHLTFSEWSEHCADSLKFLPEQVERQCLIPSVIALNSNGCAAKLTPDKKPAQPTEELPLPPIPAPRTWLKHQEAPEGTSCRQETTASAKEDKPPEQEERHERDLEALRSDVDELQTIVRQEMMKLDLMKKNCESVEVELRGRVEEYDALCRALELLPDYAENVNKVESLINLSNKRFESLNGQWENYKKGLVAEYEQFKRSSASQINEIHLKNVNELRLKTRNAGKQIRTKQQAMLQLQKEFDQLPKNIIRSSYTRRIVEIIGNIKKQKDEIDKILKDTRELQRNTNVMYGTLERLFTVIDETIFRNARKDEHSKRAYKRLATLHTDCADIVRMAEETGAIEREIRDLQEQVENESSKKVGDNLERISADMRLLVEENVTLTRQLKL